MADARLKAGFLLQVPPEQESSAAPAESATARALEQEPAPRRPTRRRWGGDVQPAGPAGTQLQKGQPSAPATPLRPPAQQAMSRSAGPVTAADTSGTICNRGVSHEDALQTLCNLPATACKGIVVNKSWQEVRLEGMQQHVGDFSCPGDPFLCQHNPLLCHAGPAAHDTAAGQLRKPEEPPLAPDVPAPAPDIPSDSSFRLPEGVDPLSAVLLGKVGQAAPSEDNSASEDGGDAEGSAGAAPDTEGAAGGTSAAAPPAAPLPLPPAEPRAAAAKSGAGSGTIASPGEAPVPPAARTGATTVGDSWCVLLTPQQSTQRMPYCLIAVAQIVSPPCEASPHGALLVVRSPQATSHSFEVSCCWNRPGQCIWGPARRWAYFPRAAAKAGV